MIKSEPWPAVAVTEALSRSFRFACSTKVRDYPGFCIICRQSAANSEERMVAPVADLQGMGLEVDGTVKQVRMPQGRLSFESKANPRRTQTFSPNCLLVIIVPTNPATGSTMADQCRLITFRIHRRAVLAAVVRQDRVIVGPGGEGAEKICQN
jgi:hypothetical protein